MSYTIRFRREPPITLPEWKTAVEAMPCVRLDSSGSSAEDPKTGARVFVPGADGDTKITIDGEWYTCFLWSESGAPYFKYTSDFGDTNSQMRRIANELAQKLGARLVGEGDKEYQTTAIEVANPPPKYRPS
jgi:hypothetical protein